MTECSIGYSKDFRPNKDFAEMGLFCEFEHCIERMPLVRGVKSCPVFGHDCPAGEKRSRNCEKEVLSEKKTKKG